MYLDGVETERLRIRKLNKSDVDTWALFFDNNPSLEYLGLDLRLDSKVQAIDWIERQLWRYENGKFGHHALIEKKTNRFIGQCGLLSQEIDGEQVIEIGYHILPEYWGSGYATEAAQLFRNFAFDNEICQSLVSIIDIRNKASQRVAEKNGMQIDKQSTYYELDVYVYKLTIETYKGLI
ncbi:GNAT family N-acetyltransferase [Ancylomarina sp. YFZ004]